MTQTDDPGRGILPYRDDKDVGAADFTFAINATFRFVKRRFGMEGLKRYWTDLGRGYFRPVSERWQREGLDGVAAYWRAFFNAEPGAEVEIVRQPGVVVVEVKRCPAIRHLRASGREIVSEFCQHCYFQEEAMAASAGMAMRLTGGNGSCRHEFHAGSTHAPEQDLAAIKEATC